MGIFSYSEGHVEKLRTRITNLERENRNLKEALSKYGMHLFSCAKLEDRDEKHPCTCGFENCLETN